MALFQVIVDLWQVSQVPVTPACVALAGLALRWQLEHWAVTLKLVCSLAGVHALVPDLWQVSQLALPMPAMAT